MGICAELAVTTKISACGPSEGRGMMYGVVMGWLVIVRLVMVKLVMC